VTKAPTRKHLKPQPKVEKLPTSIPSVALRRIIEEVSAAKDMPSTGYNRTYHRHNR
jgi:hypothetical protein